jgi:hypothetical protein
MFISVELKKLIEKCANDWMTDHPGWERRCVNKLGKEMKIPENTSTPFAIHSSRDTKVLYCLMFDKLSWLKEQYDVEEILKPYEKHSKYDEGEMFIEKRMEGHQASPREIQEREERIKKIMDAYAIPASFKKDLHRFVLFAPLVDSSYGRRPWEELWISLKSKRLDTIQQREGNSLYQERQMLQQTSLPSAIQIAMEMGKVDGIRTADLIYMLCAYLQCTPVERMPINAEYYGGEGNIQAELRRDVWEYIYDDYRKVARKEGHQIQSKEECMTSQEELTFYMEHSKASEQQRRWVSENRRYLSNSSNTANPGSFNHLRNLISKYDIDPNSFKEKSVRTIFSNYLRGEKMAKSQPQISATAFQVGEPNNAMKDAIALFVDYPNWDCFCSRTNYFGENKEIAEMMTSAYSIDSDFLKGYNKKLKKGQIVRIGFSTQDRDGDGQLHTDLRGLFLRTLDAAHEEFEVVQTDGYVKGLTKGMVIRLTELRYHSPLVFVNKKGEGFSTMKVDTADLEVETFEENDRCKEEVSETDRLKILRTYVEMRLEKECGLTFDENGKPKRGSTAISTLMQEKGVNIPRSNLSRFWANAGMPIDKIETPHENSMDTLNKLAQFVGYESFDDFVFREVSHIREIPFGTPYYLADFNIGDHYCMSYFPNRKVVFTVIEKKDGGKACRIDSVKKSRLLKKGDIFEFVVIQTERNATLYSIVRDGELLPQDITTRFVKEIKKLD